jgi:hypothetical protein
MLQFHGADCQLSMRGQISAADIVCLSNMMQPGALPPGTTFTELTIEYSAGENTHVVPNQDLFERFWAQLRTSPAMCRLQKLKLHLPAVAFGAPSCRAALQSLHHLRSMSLAPIHGGMTCMHLLAAAYDDDDDEDTVMERASVRSLSWVSRAMDTIPQHSLQAAMNVLFKEQAHTLDKSNCNSRMSLNFQRFMGAAYQVCAGAPWVQHGRAVHHHALQRRRTG